VRIYDPVAFVICDVVDGNFLSVGGSPAIASRDSSAWSASLLAGEVGRVVVVDVPGGQAHAAAT